MADVRTRVSAPALLVVCFLSATSGCVDAVSFISFRTVFTANMTGNIVLLGLGIAHVTGLWVAGLCCAVGGFCIGTFGSTWYARRRNLAGPRLLVHCLIAQLVVMLVLTAWIGVTGARTPTAMQLAFVGLMGAGMGAQGTAAREAAVPFVSTLAFTSTLQRAASHFSIDRGTPEFALIAALVCIVLGAAASALLQVHAIWLAMLLSCLLIAVALSIAPRLHAPAGGIDGTKH